MSWDTMLVLKGKTLDEPLTVGDIKSGYSIQTLEDLYPLREVEFVHLKNNNNGVKQWAVQIFFIVIGYAISIGPQIYDDFTKITKGQWVIGIIGIIACALLGFASIFTKDDKKEVMKKMEDFFSSKANQQ